jgi:hypothetical protein
MVIGCISSVDCTHEAMYGNVHDRSLSMRYPYNADLDFHATFGSDALAPDLLCECSLTDMLKSRVDGHASLSDIYLSHRDVYTSRLRVWALTGFGSCSEP